MDWPAIVEHYRSIVWLTIHRLVPEPEDAAECFQATFLAAWQVSQKQTIRNWSALLRRLATARALERCRVLARNRARHAEFPAEEVVERRLCDPASQAETTELESLLRTALAELPPQEAEVFCLACLDELTYREIGALLALSVNHVGVLLHRARVQLRLKFRSLDSFANSKEIAE